MKSFITVVILTISITAVAEPSPNPPPKLVKDTILLELIGTCVTDHPESCTPAITRYWMVCAGQPIPEPDLIGGGWMTKPRGTVIDISVRSYRRGYPRWMPANDIVRKPSPQKCLRGMTRHGQFCVKTASLNKALKTCSEGSR